MGSKQIDIQRNTRKKLGKSENDKKYCKKKNFVHVDSGLPYLGPVVCPRTIIALVIA